MRLKKKLSILAAPIVLLAANNVLADFDFCPTPYVGADFGFRHMGFKDNRGSNLVKKNYPQGNVYVGLKFTDYLGIEGGFESTTSVRRTSTITNADQQFGVILDPTNPGLNTFVTTSRIYGWHADLVGFLPVCDENCVSLIGSVGIANLRLKVRSYPTLLDSGAIPPLLPDDYRTFIKNKYVARLGFGIQQMLSNCAGIRLMANWENTSKFNNIPAKENLNVGRNFRASAKDSYSLSLGVFYQF